MAALDDIVKALKESGKPLSVTEIASKIGCDAHECDAILWQSPAKFVWQPGRKWALVDQKSDITTHSVIDAPDARSNMMSAATPVELRAITMSSGLSIVVNRRPLDSEAFFTVRSAGNTVTLTLNASHELFASLPMPFDEQLLNSDYKALCETLLSAWALFEDGLPVGSARRAAEDARLHWGRRAVEMIRENDT
jgi:hypothetical protein